MFSQINKINYVDNQVQVKSLAAWQTYPFFFCFTSINSKTWYRYIVPTMHALTSDGEQQSIKVHCISINKCCTIFWKYTWRKATIIEKNITRQESSV